MTAADNSSYLSLRSLPEPSSLRIASESMWESRGLLFVAPGAPSVGPLSLLFTLRLIESDGCSVHESDRLTKPGYAFVGYA